MYGCGIIPYQRIGATSWPVAAEQSEQITGRRNNNARFFGIIRVKIKGV
jgi:hypothetical protein